MESRSAGGTASESDPSPARPTTFPKHPGGPDLRAAPRAAVLARSAPIPGDGVAPEEDAGAAPRPTQRWTPPCGSEADAPDPDPRQRGIAEAGAPEASGEAHIHPAGSAGTDESARDQTRQAAPAGAPTEAGATEADAD